VDNLTQVVRGPASLRRPDWDLLDGAGGWSSISAPETAGSQAWAKIEPWRGLLRLLFRLGDAASTDICPQPDAHGRRCGPSRCASFAIDRAGRGRRMGGNSGLLEALWIRGDRLDRSSRSASCVPGQSAGNGHPESLNCLRRPRLQGWTVRTVAVEAGSPSADGTESALESRPLAGEMDNRLSAGSGAVAGRSVRQRHRDGALR